MEIKETRLSTQLKETFQTGRTAQMWIGLWVFFTGETWHGQGGHLGGRPRTAVKHRMNLEERTARVPSSSKLWHSLTCGCLSSPLF